MIAICLMEACDCAPGKAHGLQDIGVARIRISNRIARYGGMMRGSAEAARHDLIDDRQQSEDDGTSEREGAQPGMQHVNEGEKQRDRMKVEQGDQPRAAEIPADGLDVAATFK